MFAVKEPLKAKIIYSYFACLFVYVWTDQAQLSDGPDNFLKILHFFHYLNPRI